MRVFYTEPFQKDYQRLPVRTQKALDKALKFLNLNLRHPSLRVKKLPGTIIFYARITRGYRFTFQHKNGVMVIRRAGTHKVLNSERRKTNQKQTL